VDEVVVLCRSEGRQEKDRAIREKQEARLLKDLERFKRAIRAIRGRTDPSSMSSVHWRGTSKKKTALTRFLVLFLPSKDPVP